jgi:hypothetical protein
MARPKKPLAPLIPLDQLKSVVAGLIAAPKDTVEKIEATPPKRKRVKRIAFKDKNVR